MATYDYEEGYKRINDILNAKLEVIEDKIPGDDSFTYDNSYYGWVTSLFIDIRNSTEIFQDDNKIETSKIIRAFTSEIIEILRQGNNYRQIGIRGDCVFAIYATPTKEDIDEVFNKAVYANTCMKMLNKMFRNKGFSAVDYGIGIASGQELVVKAGRKSAGIKDLVWIGGATSEASNLSSIGSNSTQHIYLSICTFNNIIDLENKSNKQASTWFNKVYSKYGTLSSYSCEIIITSFDNWINNNL